MLYLASVKKALMQMKLGISSEWAIAFPTKLKKMTQGLAHKPKYALY